MAAGPPVRGKVRPTLGPRPRCTGELSRPVAGPSENLLELAAAASATPFTATRIRCRASCTAHHHVDWAVLCAALIGWAEDGFSLLRAGREAACTPQHLIFRLEKNPRLSGTDVREPKRASAVHLACMTDLLDEPG